MVIYSAGLRRIKLLTSIFLILILKRKLYTIVLTRQFSGINTAEFTQTAGVMARQPLQDAGIHFGRLSVARAGERQKRSHMNER